MTSIKSKTKSKKIRNTLLSLGLLTSMLTASAADAKVDIEFILDASGSMRAAMGGQTQMDVAKQSIKSAIEQIPADTFVALRVYAHRVEQTDKVGSCQDTELMIPFGPIDRSIFSAKVDSIQAKGYTPIGFSLQEAGKDMSAVTREADHVLVLVSDGEETCGIDPLLVVKDLQAKGIKFKLSAVGFNADAKTQAQLKALAEAGGGQYYDAKDASSLANSLKDITQKAVLIEKTTAVYGSEVRGGDSYETATPLVLNQELRLDHHQKKGMYDYFYVDLKSGQSLTMSMNTREKGITINGTQVQENDNPYAGFQIHDSQRTRVVNEDLIGLKNLTKKQEYAAPLAGRYYVLVGSMYDNMHKDHPFKAEVKDYFDVGTTSDAGSTPETAITIQKLSYPTSYLTKSDESDLYKIATTAGETLAVKIVPENPQATLTASFMDDLKVVIAGETAANQGAGLRIRGVATGAVTYLRIARAYGEDTTKYSIEFENAAMVPVAPQPTTALTPPPPPPQAQEVAQALTQAVEDLSKATEAVKPAPVAEIDIQSILKNKKSLQLVGGIFAGGLVLGIILGIVLKSVFGTKYIKP